MPRQHTYSQSATLFPELTQMGRLGLQSVAEVGRYTESRWHNFSCTLREVDEVPCKSLFSTDTFRYLGKQPTIFCTVQPLFRMVHRNVLPHTYYGQVVLARKRCQNTSLIVERAIDIRHLLGGSAIFTMAAWCYTYKLLAQVTNGPSSPSTLSACQNHVNP